MGARRAFRQRETCILYLAKRWQRRRQEKAEYVGQKCSTHYTIHVLFLYYIQMIYKFYCSLIYDPCTPKAEVRGTNPLEYDTSLLRFMRDKRRKI